MGTILHSQCKYCGGVHDIEGGNIEEIGSPYTCKHRCLIHPSRRATVRIYDKLLVCSECDMAATSNPAFRASLVEKYNMETLMVDNKKDTNPKDAVGIKKVPMSVVPAGVLMEVTLALLEGARKYGRHNYRDTGVRASVYYDALHRHVMAWWEGQDIDADSNLNHITKAIATLVVLRDAMMNNMWVDDRPPKMADQNWVSDMNKKATEIIEKYPNPVVAYTEVDAHFREMVDATPKGVIKTGEEDD